MQIKMQELRCKLTIPMKLPKTYQDDRKRTSVDIEIVEGPDMQHPAAVASERDERARELVSDECVMGGWVSE